MGSIDSISICRCMNKTANNVGNLNIEISKEIVSVDQYKDGEQKTGPCTYKKSFKIDKSNFIRMKEQKLIDEYDIQDKLGEGAYGSVYKVQQKVTGYLRAVKAIKKKLVDPGEFDNEMDLLKTVDHPNIIKLFDCYQDDQHYFMVEEYCSGGDLFDYIQKEKCFTEKKASIIFNQLLSAVNHLHHKRIVHRDLKPENIVFIESKNKEIFIKLIDFGTAITIRRGNNLRDELGTIYYIAPEVFLNDYNEKADVWSCGIILYTMLCGHPPFLGKSEQMIRQKILHGKLTFPQREFRDVSPDAIEYIKKLLTYKQENRPSADQALNDPWLVNIVSKAKKQLSEYIITNLTKFRATLGLQKATIAFLTSQISINEEIKTLKEEFDKIDVDKDGDISKDELAKCLESIYPPFEAKRKADDILKEIDFNNDGSINFSEFITVNIKKEKLLSEDTLRRAFHMFDIDGNGYVTIDELKESMPLEVTSDNAWVALVGEVDKDGDCQISFNEFKEMMQKLIDSNG